MTPEMSRSRLHRPNGLRAGVGIGLALALVGAVVGTATGAVTPFQKVVIVNAPSSPIPVELQGTGTITGTVAVSNLPANQPVTVTNLPATQPVSGTVNIGNLPAAPAAPVANKTFYQGYSFEDGTYADVTFGRTINVSYIRISDVTNGDGIRVYLVTANGTEGELFDGDAPFKESFTLPVPATGLSILCTNLVVDCNIGVFVVGS